MVAAMRTALTIAGSDSGGGAGLQADLKSFTAVGVHGTSVITCVTSQNTHAVTSIFPLPAAEIRSQIRAVLDDFEVRGAKTGMLYSREIIEAVAVVASRPGFPPLVVDPVMVATSGARLLQDDAVSAYRERLLPRAALVTPNLDEAKVFLGRAIASADAMPDAARRLADSLGCPVLLKGGHLAGETVVDVLWDGRRSWWWEGNRIGGVTTHGTGCTLSAAVAARLSHGDMLPEACAAARDHLRRVMMEPAELSDGRRLLG